jgi:hypothetical protein
MTLIRTWLDLAFQQVATERIKHGVASCNNTLRRSSGGG